MGVTKVKPQIVKPEQLKKRTYKSWFDDCQVVILAAGKGERMQTDLPKALIQVDGKSLLHHSIAFWRRFTDKFVFVTGYRHMQVNDQVFALSMPFDYDPIIVIQEEQTGISDAVMLALPKVAGKFVVTFADCIFRGDFEIPDDMTYGIAYHKHDAADMRAGYRVEVEGGLIYQTKEKPVSYCGLGAYFFYDKYMLELYEPRHYRHEWTEYLNDLHNVGVVFHGVPFTGVYHNVNTPEDIATAEFKLKLRGVSQWES